MPDWPDKDGRQLEHINESQLDRGKSKEDAKEVAAQTVNKQRREVGRTPNASTHGFIIVNFANQHYEQYEFGLPDGGTWKHRFSSDRTAYSDDFGGNSSSALTRSTNPMTGNRAAAESNCRFTPL